MRISFFLFLLTAASCASAQNHKRYWTTGGDIILSWADYSDSGQKFTGPPRFSMFFHVGARHNWDFGRCLGMGMGIGLRNIGFITVGEAPQTKLKRRTYTLGVPLYLKIGNMDRRKYVMLGAEYELAFHYKYKRFVNGDKVEKIQGWFSKQTNRFLPSVFVAYNYRNVALKFQYYLGDLLNKDFEDLSGPVAKKPYAYTESRMFFVALMVNIFNDRSAVPNRKKEKDSGNPERKAFRFHVRN